MTGEANLSNRSLGDGRQRSRTALTMPTEGTSAAPARRSMLTPGSWRADLLTIVIRVTAALGAIAYLPSVYISLKFRMTGIAVLDTVAIVAIIALAVFHKIPSRVRAACGCLVLYAVGVGLMIGVGSISQIYLIAFSLLATLLLSFRWGVGTVALNAATMTAIGLVGVAAPDMVVPRWSWNATGWLVITANFVIVNAGLVLALGAVISALETALADAVSVGRVLENERHELVKLNASLEEEVRERARTEESLRETKALLRIAGAAARLGGWQLTLGKDEIVWSDEVCDLHEVPLGTRQPLADALAFYAPEYRGTIGEVVDHCMRGGTAFDLDAEIVTATGARRWVRVIGQPLRNAGGEITQVHGSVQDITPQKVAEARHGKLEEQLRQAQKMEAIGRLAGGVAHDFNNLLSVVLSYSHLLLDDPNVVEPMRSDIGEIGAAGQRAADLTRQLLAFSRQQVVEPKVLDLNALLASMDKMLQRLLGADVDFVTVRGADLATVRADPGSIEQVIMNLVVNARDAMPTGGQLTLETANVVLDEAFVRTHFGAKPGPHVMLAVSDTGCGIDKATLAHIFEPFFTTKDKDKGTGLGLSTVLGIVQQSGGTVWVYSEPRKGTAFKVYLPVVGVRADILSARGTGESTPRGVETILLVEDEIEVRAVARTILVRHGYHVLVASNAGEAILISQQHAGVIDLLLTDVVMPRMSGPQLAKMIVVDRPLIKVLCMSGYTDDSIVRHGVLDMSVAYLQKPITPETLTRRVREVLDGVPGRPAVAQC